VYPTAFFVMTLLGAFVLLEHDHPWLAGMVGALATAPRPTGVVLVVALAVRAIERRRELDGDPAGPGRNRPIWWDAGVLLSARRGRLLPLPVRRFGDPFAFVTVQEAWDQESGVRTWLKPRFFEDLATLPYRKLLAFRSPTWPILRSRWAPWPWCRRSSAASGTAPTPCSSSCSRR
jgi:hypothetical protein